MEEEGRGPFPSGTLLAESRGHCQWLGSSHGHPWERGAKRGAVVSLAPVAFQPLLLGRVPAL